MNETKRVAIYARVSTAEQTAENQLLDLRRFCSARGWDIVEEYIDVGISGAKKDRPHLQRLMEDARKRRMDCVLVWRFDRFARSISHLVQALEEFKSLRVGFSSYSESLDTTTSHGELIFNIMGSIAQFERALIIERINAGLRRAHAQGKRSGRPGLPQSKVDEIIALRGKASTRQIAARVGVGKSVVHKVLSIKPIQNVASVVDGTSVAF